MRNKIFFCFLFFFILPVISDDLINQAESLYQKGKYEEAIKICLKIKKVYPGSDWDLSAHFITAKIYEARGENEKAIEEYKKIIFNFKDNIYAEEAFFYIAKIRTKMGQYINAVKAYEAYIQKFPDGKYIILAIFNAALIYKQNANYSEALNKFNDILRKYNSDFWFYNWSAIYSGHIYAEKGDFDKAIEYYDRVIKKENNEALLSLANLYKGMIFIKKKDYEKAKDTFQKILKTTSSFSEEAMLGLAEANFKSGEYELANEIYQSLLEIYPDTVWKNYAENKIKKLKKFLEKN